MDFHESVLKASEEINGNFISHISGAAPTIDSLKKDIAHYLQVNLTHVDVEKGYSYLDNLANNELWETRRDKLKWMKEHLHCIEAQTSAYEDGIRYAPGHSI